MLQPVARLLITLDDLTPPIWRRVEVPLSSSLLALHRVIQTVMLWEDIHLFEFQIGDKLYGAPTSETAAYGRNVYRAKALRLATLVDRSIDTFRYVYDFGDDWSHQIIIEAVFDGDPATSYPCFVDGKRRAPPEDVGGPPGFMEFTQAMKSRSHPEHKQMLRWYGGPFDPEDVEIAAITDGLRRLADRRREGQERIKTARQASPI